MVLAIVLIIYVNALSRGIEENEVRAMNITTIVIADLGLILTTRSWSETILTNIFSPNTALVYVFLGTRVLPCSRPVRDIPTGPVPVWCPVRCGTRLVCGSRNTQHSLVRTVQVLEWRIGKTRRIVWSTVRMRYDSIHGYNQAIR